MDFQVRVPTDFSNLCLALPVSGHDGVMCRPRRPPVGALEAFLGVLELHVAELSYERIALIAYVPARPLPRDLR